MKIRFLFGYSGRETAMKAYSEGEIVDLAQQAAIELVQAGIAEEVTEFVMEPLPDAPKVKKVKHVTDK
jgi:hypothetical protein